MLAFLKIDFWLTFKNSLALAILYLLLIPVIRGISNLNVMQSAQCFAQSASLLGVILLVPVTGKELGTEIRESIGARVWSYRKSLILRLMCSFLLLLGMTVLLACAMKKNHCDFPFWQMTAANVLYGEFLGLAGLVSAQLGGSSMAGYLASLGYWSLGQLQTIEEGSAWYLFPVAGGEAEPWKFVILLALTAVLLMLFLSGCKRPDREAG